MKTYLGVDGSEGVDIGRASEEPLVEDEEEDHGNVGNEILDGVDQEHPGVEELEF